MSDRTKATDAEQRLLAEVHNDKDEVNARFAREWQKLINDPNREWRCLLCGGAIKETNDHGIGECVPAIRKKNREDYEAKMREKYGY